MRAGFIWDDDEYVEQNLTLRTTAGLARIWFDTTATPQYYPLVHTTFWIEYRLWGLDSTGYHVVNILLHGAASLVLFLVLCEVGFPAGIAWAAAAVFALHPVNVESVAWITERKNVLSALLYLCAGLAFLRCGPWTTSRTGPRSVGLYTLSLLLFLGALLSKTITSSLPLALLLILWWKRGRVLWRDTVWVAPMFFVGAVLGLHTLWLERSHVGALGDEWSFSLLERTLVAGRAVWFYFGKILWPAQLTFIYPRWSIDTAAPGQYLFPLAALSALAVLWALRARIGRGPLVGALFFVVTLSPAIGFFDVYPMRYSFVADHFQYLACIGLIVSFVALGDRCTRRAGRLRHPAAIGLLATGLVVLGLLSWDQSHVYRDRETLWRDTLAKNPAAGMAHSNLAGELDRQGRLDEALIHFREALRLVESAQIKIDYAQAHNNVGYALLRKGRVGEAVPHLLRALEIDPGHALANNNLGVVLEQAGRIEEAVGHYTRALRRKPDYGNAQANLARAQAALGRAEN